MKPWKIGALVIGALLALFVLSQLLWTYGLFAGATKGVLERTFDPDNIIASYESFRDQHQTVLAMDRQYEDADRAATDYLTLIGGTADTLLESRQFERLDTIRRGIRFRQNEIIAAYNADASKANKEIFQNPGLGDSVPDKLTLR